MENVRREVYHLVERLYVVALSPVWDLIVWEEGHIIKVILLLLLQSSVDKYGGYWHLASGSSEAKDNSASLLKRESGS